MTSTPPVIHIATDDSAIGEHEPVRWSCDQLETVLSNNGARVRRDEADAAATAAVVETDVRVLLTSRDSQAGSSTIVAAGLPAPQGEEAFTVVRPHGADGAVVVVAGGARGAVYGLLELADVVGTATDPVAALRAVPQRAEAPAAWLRGILRPFVSDVEDMPWFYDKAFWSDYLTELVTHRVNRFQLALGMQYNYGHHPATDNYFCFPYPFLLEVPGYEVYAENVSAQERERNLVMLRFISDETKRRGMRFQLGLWNHAYDQGDGSAPRYPVRGLTPQTHAEYSAAALARLLTECPSIDGLTLRVHYEGGIPEPDHAEFWQTVMAATNQVDRPIELDMHAKGVDNELLDVARDTGQLVAVSAKYWAEHWGLPYHQTSIRERERATKGQGRSLMSITANERRFTRYGFGDFLHEDRDYDVDYRIWPGGQRVLLWGDPALAAGYGRLSTIAGSRGVELCEPLSFKGRKDTGRTGGRDPYADPELRLDGQEWRKYRYTYRLWGRLLYDPDADPAGWRRFLTAEFGAAAEAVEEALGAVSRVIPLVTVVHGLGGSNNGYWPEMYVDMPIVAGPHAEYYAFDTPVPPRFGTVGSFDPSLFYGAESYADDVVVGRRDGRYSPIDVAEWLEDLAATGERSLATARQRVSGTETPDFRRMAVDVSALAGIARYFAGKFRAAVNYALYERIGHPDCLDEALADYESARDAYAAVAEVTTGVYNDDLTFGHQLTEHGHWADRLPAIEEDLRAMRRRRNEAGSSTGGEPVRPASPPRVSRPEVGHEPPPGFRPGAEVSVNVALSHAFDGSVVLHYRHLNQGADYQTVEMTRSSIGGREQYTAVIPAAYTDSAYPVTYYLSFLDTTGDGWVWPGLDPRTLANQPYYLLRRV